MVEKGIPPIKKEEVKVPKRFCGGTTRAIWFVRVGVVRTSRLNPRKLPTKTSGDERHVQIKKVPTIVKNPTDLADPAMLKKTLRKTKRVMHVPGKRVAVYMVFNFQFFPPMNLKMRAETYPATTPEKQNKMTISVNIFPFIMGFKRLVMLKQRTTKSATAI